MNKSSPICALCLLLALPLQAAEVRLGTNIAASQFHHADGGGSAAHVECIMARLDQPVSIQSMPWRRARQEVSSGKIDGFFTAIPIPQVDRYATLSAPLVLENWYWFWRSDLDEPETWQVGHRLGVILGSHQAVWLQQNDHPVHTEVGSLEQLVKLIISGRIDAFIADLEHLESVVEHLGLDPGVYHQRFLRYTPLGVYFGEHYLRDNPGFIRAFNRQIYGCAPAAFEMSLSEQQRVRAWVEPLLTEWLEAAPMKAEVARQNRQRKALTQEDINARDQQWIDEFYEGGGPVSRAMLQTELSGWLRALAVETGGRITEVILTDERGANVAVSDMTSDYWQGNETKYLKAWPLQPGELHFDPVTYDESAKRFQVHVSRLLADPGTGERIGVLVVGVDVEHALSRDY